MYIQVKLWNAKMRTKSFPLDLNGTCYCVSLNFRRTARAVTSLYDMALRETGIRSTLLAILVGIAKNQPVSMGAFADVLVIDSATLTRSVQLLQKVGIAAISNRAAM